MNYIISGNYFVNMSLLYGLRNNIQKYWVRDIHYIRYIRYIFNHVWMCTCVVGMMEILLAGRTQIDGMKIVRIHIINALGSYYYYYYFKKKKKINYISVNINK